jgi:hypothetical protein
MNTEIIEDLDVLEKLESDTRSQFFKEKSSGFATQSDQIDKHCLSTNEVCIQKPKKPRTEKQIIAFNLVLEKRNENRRQRALAREKEEDEEKKAIEEKIIKKAQSIKKKQIKKELVLDNISDDDEPVENIKKRIMKRDEREKKAVIIPVIPAIPEKPRVIYM